MKHEIGESSDSPTQERLLEIFASPIQDLWRLHFIVMKNNDIASKYFNNSFGLNSQSWSSMYCINCFPGITVGEICQIMPRPHNTVSRGVSELIKLGLVCGKPGADRRKRHLYLTMRGSEVQNAMYKLSLARQKEVFGALSDRELGQLRQLLGKIAFNPKLSDTELIGRNESDRKPGADGPVE